MSLSKKKTIIPDKLQFYPNGEPRLIHPPARPHGPHAPKEYVSVNHSIDIDNSSFTAAELLAKVPPEVSKENVFVECNFDYDWGYMSAHYVTEEKNKYYDKEIIKYNKKNEKYLKSLKEWEEENKRYQEYLRQYNEFLNSKEKEKIEKQIGLLEKQIRSLKKKKKNAHKTNE